MEDTNASSQQSTDGASSSNTRAENNANPNPNAGRNSQDLIKYITDDKISAVLWLTRLLTIVFSFLFIVPLFGYDPNTLFQKAMMSSAATSALKLHQRISNVPFQFSRDYFARLIVEDSFHYLLYSFIFLSISPVTIVLMPVTAFALLHLSAYSKNILNLAFGAEGGAPLRKLFNIVLSRDKEIMRFVAMNEIIIMPTLIIMIFMGRAGIFLPFVYYRFICMRYQSRRNPYNRIMFYELRTLVDYYSSQPTCPGFVRNLSQSLINFVQRFAPPQTA